MVTVPPLNDEDEPAEIDTAPPTALPPPPTDK